jgi:hypothetical protein
MADYRNLNSDFPNPEDPLRHGRPYEPDVRNANASNPNATWGWIAGAAVVVVALALIFGIGHAPNQPGPTTLANNITPPATRMAPLPARPAVPPTPPTFAPAPSTPAPNSTAQ